MNKNKTTPDVSTFLSKISGGLNKSLLNLLDYCNNDNLNIISYPFLKNIIPQLDDYNKIPEKTKQKLRDVFELLQFKDRLYKEHYNPMKDKLNNQISYDDLLESLIIMVEVSTYGHQFNREEIINIGIPTYSELTLKAISKILEDTKLTKQGFEQDRLNLPIQNLIIILWASFQILRADEMIDQVIFDDYILVKDNDLIGTEFIGNEEINFHFLEMVKEQAKKQFYTRDNKNKVSADKFFQANDSKLKTNEGLAVMIISDNAEVTYQKKGTTTLKMAIDDFDFQDKQGNKVSISEYIKLDAKEQQLYSFLPYEKIGEQHLAYYYRKIMEENYTPKEEDEIKKLIIYLDNGAMISVHSIISMTAWIKAWAVIINNPVSFGWLPNSYFISEIFKNINPPQSYTEQEISRFGVEILLSFIKDYDKLLNVKVLNPFFEYIDMEAFTLKTCEKNEDLKDYSIATLKTILEYVTGNGGLKKIRLVGLSRIDERKLRLIPNAFSNIDHIANIYNSLILKDLYNNNDGQNLGNQNLSNSREKAICKSIAELFSKKFESQANLRFSDGSGEADNIIVDKSTKSILFIEVKLKNTYTFNRKGKYKFYKERIREKAIPQINNALRYFRSEKGENQLNDVFEINSKEYTIYTLIVTDNFYFDHSSVIYSKNKEGNLITMIVSFFEIKMLLENLELFEEGSKNWIRYHYFHILERKGLKNDNIEQYMNSEIQKEPSQEMIDFIKENRVSYFENEQLTIPELMQVIRKENKLWRPFHFWDFD